MKRLTLLFLFVVTLDISPSLCAAQITKFKRESLKDVSQARHLAVNNTLIPLVAGVGAANLFKAQSLKTIGSSLAIYGLIVGPSTGNFYAEDYLRGSLGLLARAGGALLLQNATRELLGKNVSESLGWDHKSVSLTDTRVLVGASLVLGSIVYNIISVKASVETHNRSLGYGYTMKIEENPANGRPVPALAAYLRF